jgi:hypothetical protein
MGMWSKIGSALLTGGAAIAAPFTGGTSLAALPAILGGAGAVVGAMGGAATANRGEQDKLNLSRDSIGLGANNAYENALQGRAVLELKQREAAQLAEQEAFKSALRSALAMNMKDVSVDRSQFKSNVPTISFAGGARPSAIGPQGLEAAGAMNNLALQRLLSPPQDKELPAVEKFQQSEPSKASFWEKLAGPVGLGLQVAGMGLDAKNKPGQAPVVLSNNFRGSQPFDNIQF